MGKKGFKLVMFSIVLILIAIYITIHQGSNAYGNDIFIVAFACIVGLVNNLLNRCT
jgi:hypothetical protein